MKQITNFVGVIGALLIVTWFTNSGWLYYFRPLELKTVGDFKDGTRVSLVSDLTDTGLCSVDKSGKTDGYFYSARLDGKYILIETGSEFDNLKSVSVMGRVKTFTSESTAGQAYDKLSGQSGDYIKLVLVTDNNQVVLVNMLAPALAVLFFVVSLTLFKIAKRKKNADIEHMKTGENDFRFTFLEMIVERDRVQRNKSFMVYALLGVALLLGTVYGVLVEIMGLTFICLGLLAVIAIAFLIGSKAKPDTAKAYPRIFAWTPVEQREVFRQQLESEILEQKALFSDKYANHLYPSGLVVFDIKAEGLAQHIFACPTAPMLRAIQYTHTTRVKGGSFETYCVEIYLAGDNKPFITLFKYPEMAEAMMVALNAHFGISVEADEELDKLIKNDYKEFESRCLLRKQGAAI